MLGLDVLDLASGASSGGQPELSTMTPASQTSMPPTLLELGPRA